MKKFAVAFPYSSEPADFAAFSHEALDVRGDEHAASRAALGVVDERVWVQTNPDGSKVAVVYLVGRDPIEDNKRFAASQEPYDLWFKDKASKVTGQDIHEPFPVHPDLVYESIPAGADPAHSAFLALPLIDTDAYLAMVAEVNGPRRAAFDAFHERAGITEDWYLERTPDGDFALVHLSSPDLGKAVGHLASSTDEIEQWFKAQLLASQGIDWNEPPAGPLPECVMSWQAR